MGDRLYALNRTLSRIVEVPLDLNDCVPTARYVNIAHTACFSRGTVDAF